MSNLLGYMGFLEIASKVDKKLNFENFSNFEGDFKETMYPTRSLIRTNIV